MIISIYQANGSETTALFLQFPQIDTTPRGESRHKTHDQIHVVYHNCSFYWHHPGFYNLSMDRLLKKASQKDCSMKDNIFSRIKKMCCFRGQNFFIKLNGKLNAGLFNSYKYSIFNCVGC